jgi:hypothetical protein
MKATPAALAATLLLATPFLAAPAAAQDAAPGADIFERLDGVGIKLNGYFEFAASYLKQGDEKTSDFSLAEIDLGFNIQLADKLSAEIVLIYEDGDEDGVSIDTAIGTYQFTDELSLSAGRFTVPFGKFETEMLSDPLTLALGEISSDGVSAAWETDLLTLTVAVFDSAAIDSDTIETFSASLEIAPKDGVSFGVSVVSDLAGGAMSDAVNEALEAGGGYSKAAGVSAFAKAAFGIATLSAEYVGAVDDMEITDAEGGIYAAKPQAWFAELSLALADDVTAALRYEGSKDFLPEEMPESIFGAAVKYAFLENATLGLEYLVGKVKEGDDLHQVTANIVLEF